MTRTVDDDIVGDAADALWATTSDSASGAPLGGRPRLRRVRRFLWPNPPSTFGPDVRRYIKACTIGVVATLPVYLFALWHEWGGSWAELRGYPPTNFYEVQARAMFRGHLWVKGSLGIEAFEHAGHQYTYFGLFPSIIRMPVMLVTSGLDGFMTAPMLLIAWVATLVASAMLFWRLRNVMRGPVPLGRSEAASWGFVMVTIAGGSVLVQLAAVPYVYDEDIAWSVALTTASLLALLGMLERPSGRRVWACGLLILCTNLDRAPTGYACSFGALLVALWLWRGRSALAGAERSDLRRWALPIAGAGVVGLLASAAVTYAKFGLPVGLPMADQVWTHLNAHRHWFLKANGGKAFSIDFLPSSIWAYFQPGGIRLTSVFPFVTAPPLPARTIGNAVLDQTYRTPSLVPTTPLLVLLGLWGSVVVFKPKAPANAALTRILLLAAAAGCGGVLLWGYIAPRYLSDLLPFFILASGIGLVDIWRRIDARRCRPRSSRLRIAATGSVLALAAWCFFANSALAVEPNLAWSVPETNRFVTIQHDLTPGALAGTVEHGTSLPYYAPGGTLFAMNDCSGLYLSTGETFKTVPGQQDYHATWLTVEQAKGDNHSINVQYNQHLNNTSQPVTIFSWDQVTIDLVPIGDGYAEVEIIGVGNPPGGKEAATFPWALPWKFKVIHNGVYPFRVMTDPNLHLITVTWFGLVYVVHYLPGNGPAVVHTTINPRPPKVRPPVTVVDVTPRWRGTPLCSALLHHR